jgi:hypothetical protein
MLLAIPSGLVALYAHAPCTEYSDEPCSDAAPFFVGGLLAGIGSLAGGTAMIYYGALDAPQPKQATSFPSPLSSNGFTLRVRF